MNFREQIYAALSPILATSAWAAANRAVTPRATYLLVTGSDNAHLNGAGPKSARYQIDIWSEDPDEPTSLAAQCKDALRAGMTIATITDNPDDWEEDTRLYKSSFDITAWAK